MPLICSHIFINHVEKHLWVFVILKMLFGYCSENCMHQFHVCNLCDSFLKFWQWMGKTCTFLKITWSVFLVKFVMHLAPVLYGYVRITSHNRWAQRSYYLIAIVNWGCKVHVPVYIRPTIMNNKDSITSLNKLLLGASARYVYERFIVDGSAVHHTAPPGTRPTVKILPVLTANLTFTANRQYLLLQPQIRCETSGSNWYRRRNAANTVKRPPPLPPSYGRKGRVIKRVAMHPLCPNVATLST